MLLNHILLSLLVFISPIFPPVIIPFSYTLIWIRLVQGSSPIWLSLSTVIPAVVSSIMIWLLYDYMQDKLERFKKKNDDKDRFSRVEYKISTYIEGKKRLSRLNAKIKHYLTHKTSKLVLFLATIVAIDSAIPDIVVIWIVRKRLPFPLFILAVIIGKATVYLPIIWAWKWILVIFWNW